MIPPPTGGRGWQKYCHSGLWAGILEKYYEKLFDIDLDNLSQKEKELLAIMAIGNESITIDEMKRITKSSNSFQLP